MVEEEGQQPEYGARSNYRSTHQGYLDDIEMTARPSVGIAGRTEIGSNGRNGENEGCTSYFCCGARSKRFRTAWNWVRWRRAGS